MRKRKNCGFLWGWRGCEGLKGVERDAGVRLHGAMDLGKGKRGGRYKYSLFKIRKIEIPAERLGISHLEGRCSETKVLNIENGK